MKFFDLILTWFILKVTWLTSVACSYLVTAAGQAGMEPCATNACRTRDAWTATVTGLRGPVNVISTGEEYCATEVS